MESLYQTFKNFTALELVAFTHSVDSPWRKVWEQNKYGDISKKDMKEWFKKYLVQE